jgi:O-antigen ligase
MNDHELARSNAGITGAFAQQEHPFELADTPGIPENPVTPTGSAESARLAAYEAPITPLSLDGEPPPLSVWPFLRGLSPFWHDRLIELGLILSMGLYYLVGNTNFGAASIFHIPPYLYSLPFLAAFAVLSWYRLSFAVALLPLALPYYMYQKTVFSLGSRDLNFGLGEISVVVCALVALGQLVVQRGNWRYRLSWRALRDRLGPFLIPTLLFTALALFSIKVAVSRSDAARAFREEVFDPLLYVVLALCCLRTWPDIRRLLGAFIGSALIIAVIGLVQYFFFSSHLQASQEGGRVLAVYGSANSIGLFFDYVLPLVMALTIFQLGQVWQGRGKWGLCILCLLSFVPLVGVLVLSQSLGTALALPIALLFILALSIRRRKVLLIGAAVLVALLLLVGIGLNKQIVHFIINWHDNAKGISTVTKRYYLWQVALHMIHDYPWFGVGMDNWLCHYTANNQCPASLTLTQHYIIYHIPGTHQSTGLSEEPLLSHPHEIFLQIWVSIGIFGLLAFLAILVLFYWLFARLVHVVRRSALPQIKALEWPILGVGGAMLAVLCQGLVDSSILEQDLAFCFWMLIVALLTLRMLTGTPWRGRITGS